MELAAAFYPLAFAAEQVAGDRAVVSDLTPPGAEPHDLELTSDDVETVEDADLLIVLGGDFQPGLEDLADRTESLVLLDSLETAGPDGDPHLWLDPLAMAEAADAIATRLMEIDPDGEADYQLNAENFRGAMEEIHREFEAGLRGCRSRVIVTAHDAFGWMAARYELRQESIAGLSPDQEPDPKRLAELTDLVKEEGVTTVFTETLVSPDVAEALAREAGVTTATLDPLESEPEGSDYAQAMRANLQELRKALDCGP